VYKTHFNPLFTRALLALAVLFSSVSIATDIDPTRPFGTSSLNQTAQLKHEDGFHLTSIIHGDGIHTAVINGKIYKMFDYLGDYRITAINSHSVILRSKSKRLKINVFNSTGFKSNVVESTVAN
jgi:MSHA biogenesis protein MshK